MKRLSFIVPMYNVEPYIERCIRSLEDQDIRQDDYEIICINDGSPDNCREVVIRLQKEFSNLILIDQENKGVSVARNNGIDRSRGKYLMMIDPDDYLKPDILSERLLFCEANNIELAFNAFEIIDTDSRVIYTWDPFFDRNKIFTGIEYFRIWYKQVKEEKRDYHHSWSIFFNSGFLKYYGLRYLPDVPYLEDGELMARIECLARKVVFINGVAYIRTVRPGSATHSNLYYSEKARNGFIKAANNLIYFRQKFCKEKDSHEFMNANIVHFTVLTIFSIPIGKYLLDFLKINRYYKNRLGERLELNGCSKWHIKLGGLYNKSVHHLYQYWLFYKIKTSFWLRMKRFFKQIPNEKYH